MGRNEDHYSNDEAGAAYFERRRAEAAGEDEDAYWAETPDLADVIDDRPAIRRETAGAAKAWAEARGEKYDDDVPF